MNIENETLYLNEKVDFEDYEQFLDLVQQTDKIHVQTNDIHPSIWQILFVLNDTKKIIVDDEFNKRFFENLKLVI